MGGSLLRRTAQSPFAAAACNPTSRNLSVVDRRVRRRACSVLLHGADERDGGTITPAHGGASRHDRQHKAARLRAQRGDGMWTRSRRARGMLDVFYPGTSATLAQPTGGAANRQ